MSVTFYSNSDSSSPGLVFIFNYTRFFRRTTRTGSVHDRNLLKNLFLTLGFPEKDIHDKGDLSQRDFFLCLHNIINLTSFNKYRSLWIFIMTHGAENDFLYAADAPFHISKIQSALSSSNKWSGIPKLLIIQACRGSETDEGVINGNFCDGDTSIDNEIVDYNIPTTSDTIFFHSTWQGFSSFRTLEGTPFIRYFVENMENHFYTEDVVKIFTKVCRDVAYNFSAKTEKFLHLKQMPCFEHSFMYKLHFGRDKTEIGEKIQLERYKMDHKERGLVIFFYQKDYKLQKMRDREAEGDVERLPSLLKDFGYTVRVEIDKTETEVREILKLTANEDFSDHDSIVIIFSGHGLNGKLFLKEGFIYTNEIWDPFTQTKTLIGKPKIFFLSACRGHSHDKGTTGDFQLPGATEQFVDQCDVVPNFTPPSKDPPIIPSNADILAVFSSAVDYVSIVDLREKVKGTFFLIALYNELHQLTNKEENIMDIIYRLNENLAKRITKDLNAEKQMSFVLSSLTKEFYLSKKITSN